MAVLEVLRFPDERLRTVAKPVDAVTQEIKDIVSDMFETMYDENGVGLAATQVDIHQRIVVIDVSEDKSQPLVLINPEIVHHSDDKMENEEGCLSVPNSWAKVQRSTEIRFQATNLDGEVYEMEADGLLAICVQHELDHLIGKLFVDYLSPLKRQRIRAKLEKEARIKARA